MAKATKNKAAKDAAGTDHITDIPHEDLPASSQPGEKLTPIPSLEERISMEIAKYDVPRATIAKWKADTAHLLNPESKDKEWYKAIKEAIAWGRGKRGAVKEKYDELTEESKLITNALRKERDELVELLFDGENPLKKVKEDYDTAEEQEKARIEQELQAKLQGRVATLIENGMRFTGSYYTIGDTTSMDVVTLKGMTDAQFDEFKGRVIAQHTEIKAAEAKEKKRQEDEQAALKEQQRLQAEQAQQLENDRKELARQRQEMEDQKNAMKKQITDSRKALLANLGFTMRHTGHMAFTIETGENLSNGINIPEEQITEMTAAGWDARYEDITKKVEGWKAKNKKYLADKAQKEQQEAKRREDERIAAEIRRLRVKARISEIGHRFQMSESTDSKIYIRESNWHGIDNITILLSRLENSDDHEWEHKLKVLEVEHKNILAAEKKLEEQRDREMKEQAEKEAADQEAARQLQLGDAQKIKLYVAKVRAIKVPELEDESMTQQLEYFLGQLDSLQEAAAEVIVPVEA